MNPTALLPFETRSDLAFAVPGGGVMIELGVARGDFAVQLIEKNPDAFYLGIDRYAGDRGHDILQYKLAMERIHDAGGEGCKLWRSTFDAAWVRVGNGTADLVYIDGYAHNGQEGGSTIEKWSAKVAPGGILAGHDYSPRWPLTVAAVDRFVAFHGLELHVIDERPYPSWWVRWPF